MPSNQEYKGKGMKGRNYDELSGVGTSSAGKTGTTGKLNDGGRDGGVGAPDLSDSGNLQSANTGQPGGTPAQGNSQRGQAGQQGGNLNQQSGNMGNMSNQQQGGRQQSGNRQSGQQGSQGGQIGQQRGQRQQGQNRLSEDDSGADDQL